MEDQETDREDVEKSADGWTPSNQLDDLVDELLKLDLDE